MRRILLLAMLGLLASACQVRTWIDVAFNDATTGTVSLQVGFDEEFRSAVGDLGQSQDLTADIRTQAEAGGWTVAEFTDGDIEGVLLSRTFGDLDELARLVNEPLAEGGESFSSFTITETDGTVRLEAQLSSLGGGTDLQFPDLITVDGRVRVTFAGEVIDHNGTIEGKTVTWTFDQESAETMGIFAEARKPGGIPWLILSVLAMVLAIGGAVWYRLAGSKPKLAIDDGTHVLEVNAED
jgi:hypothetical protein